MFKPIAQVLRSGLALISTGLLLIGCRCPEAASIPRSSESANSSPFDAPESKARPDLITVEVVPFRVRSPWCDFDSFHWDGDEVTAFSTFDKHSQKLVIVVRRAGESSLGGSLDFTIEKTPGHSRPMVRAEEVVSTDTNRGNYWAQLKGTVLISNPDWDHDHALVGLRFLLQGEHAGKPILVMGAVEVTNP